MVLLGDGTRVGFGVVSLLRYCFCAYGLGFIVSEVYWVLLSIWAVISGSWLIHSLQLSICSCGGRSCMSVVSLAFLWMSCVGQIRHWVPVVVLIISSASCSVNSFASLIHWVYELLFLCQNTGELPM